MKQLILLGFFLVLCSPVFALDSADAGKSESEISEAAASFDSEEQFDENDEFGEESEFGEEADQGQKEMSLVSQLLSPARFTLTHGVSYKTVEPIKIMNNRSSLRLEYAKLFGDTFFVQVDTKVNVYWGDDHRSREEDLRLETNTREAFLQMSFGNTSFKLGRQILIWGESDGGAITDVISPRDYSELFFIPLEESRIGQPLLVIDQFTDIGDWSLFYIPEPEFNQYPAEGTGYYYDPLAGQAELLTDSYKQSKAEYGLRWKKTFGKSDVALMGANLLENDYVYRLDGFSLTSGKSLFTKTRQRFSMVGLAFNYARGNFLYKGEIAQKSDRSFNDASYQIIKKNVRDTAIGFEYTSGSSYTMSLEAVNSHVGDWEDTLQGTPENTDSIVFVWSKDFFNDDLSFSWMSSYSTPYESVFHSLRTSYKLNDNVTFEFDAFHPDIRSSGGAYWIYRDQKQLALRALLQF
jgi:hypothetical protein